MCCLCLYGMVCIVKKMVFGMNRVKYGVGFVFIILICLKCLVKCRLFMLGWMVLCVGLIMMLKL